MDIQQALDYAALLNRGVLTTLKADGRPQLSNVMFAAGDDGIIRISVTDTRAKTRNMRRDPRISLHVTAPDFWSYVVFEGDADLTPVAEAEDDATVVELEALYRSMVGEHKDWQEYRRSMVAEGRIVVRLRPTHVYGMIPSS